MFQARGYRTGCFGKWHLGWDFDAIRKPRVVKKDWVKADSYDWTKRFPGGPIDQGFDYYFGDGTINFPRAGNTLYVRVIGFLSTHPRVLPKNLHST